MYFTLLENVITPTSWRGDANLVTGLQVYRRLGRENFSAAIGL